MRSIYFFSDWLWPYCGATIGIIQLRMEVLVTKPKPNWNFLTKTAFKYVVYSYLVNLLVYFGIRVKLLCTLHRSWIGIFFSIWFLSSTLLVLQISHLIPRMVFCYQNCSDLLWEKIVLVIEKNFWNSWLKAENLQKFWDH